MSTYSENFKLIEWLPSPASERVCVERRAKGPYLVPDIKEFVSPIDRSVIGSRSALREHEKRHAVRQCGELKTAQDFSNEPRKQESFNTRAFDQAYRAAVEKTGL